MISEQALASYRSRLRGRSDVLKQDIRRELTKYDDEHYDMLADRVADLQEHAVADLLVDLDLAEIDRDVQELREIEAALTRIAERSFGICSDCGEEIAAERLAAIPQATRCHDCQRRYETALKGETSRSL